MQIFNYNPKTVQPVSAVYSLDEDVKFKHTKDYTSSGIEFTFIDILSSLQDTSFNSHTNLYLSEPKGINSIIEVAPTKVGYPLYKVTYIKAKTSDSYWVVNNTTGVLEVSGTSNNIDNRYFFELEILDQSYLAVRHYDGSSLKYLTLNHTTSSQLAFESRISDFTDYSRIEDTQIFQYVLDEDNNTLSLLSPILTGAVGSMEIVQPTQLTIASGKVQAASVTIDTGLTDTNTFTIRSNNVSPSTLDLRNTWCSYVSGIEDNTLLINTPRSHSNIDNNFLTSTAVNDISSTMNINLLPLKNQLTTDGDISRSNPYASTENETTHRDYHQIYSGTYQEGGNDSIYLSYTSGVKDIVLPPTKLTYFHVPAVFAPYKQLNINDSPLVVCGSTFSNSPIKADKVFKRRSEGFNSKNLNDINNGTWLCAWLSGNSDPSSTPIWVDRYYNHKFATSVDALTAQTRVASITSIYTGIVSELSAQNIYVFDKRSDLVFEPEGLYAYHHIGQRDAEKHINSLKGNVLIDSLSIYKNYQDTDQHSVYEHDGPTHTMAGGSIMTGRGHDTTGIYVPETYIFDGNNYGNTPQINTTGSFTLNFWMYNSDWSTPFADQLIGNYVIDGFGIFNESFVTPVVIIPDNNKIHIYNSQYEHIDVHNVNKNVGHITRKGSTENYWFVDVSNTNNDIYEYDLKGVARNKISSPHISNKTIHDLEIDNEYLYAITGVEGNSARYFKYDLSNQNPSYVGESRAATVWNYQSSYTSAGSALRIHSINTGLSGITGGVYGTVNLEAPVIITASDKNLSQGSVVDNYGYPWVIQDNFLYTYDTSISSNIVGVSASGDQKLEAVNCDRDNNIWLLYGNNKVCKFNTNRDVSFTTVLSSTPSTSTRYIDFIHEFSDTGYTTYATILNQSLSGCRAIAVNHDGTVKTGYSVLTGDTPSTDAITHFTTPLSSYSWKSTTGFDFMRKRRPSSTPKLDAKLSLTNLYNSSTTTAANSAYTLSYCISALKAGWHNIAVVLDAEKGLYDMYIDMVRVDSINFTSTYFSYSDIFAQPLAVGTSPFYTKLVLSDHLNQPKYYYTHNTKINRLKLYNKPLDYFDLKSHYTINADIRDIRWSIPTGERNYIDTVERSFKHRLPGRKSEMYNININGLGITDDAIKSHIKSEVYSKLNQFAPIYTKLNDIVWDQATTTVSVTGTASSVGKPGTTVNISKNTTSTDTGDTQTYGY